MGQYSGGGHCCTVATILELGKDAVTPIGRIDGIDGLPFEGLEVRKLNKGTNWQCIAHRPYATACGTHFDAADVLAVYAFTGTASRTRPSISEIIFRKFFVKIWRSGGRKKTAAWTLLQTLAVDYAVVGQKDAGKRFFALNLSQLMPSLQSHNVDPNACLECPGKPGRSRARSGAIKGVGRKQKAVGSDSVNGGRVNRWFDEEQICNRSLFPIPDHPITRLKDRFVPILQDAF